MNVVAEQKLKIAEGERKFSIPEITLRWKLLKKKKVHK